MEKLTIAAIQTSIQWEAAEQNRTHFQNRIQSITQPVDVVLLPEMFTTGFSMNPQPIAETMDGDTVRWMQEQAAERQSVIAGSVIITEKENYYNRFLWVRPDGTYDHYDKRHLFSLAGENELYTAGVEIKIIEHKGWHICLNVCYDLRFPVWSRNTDEYDLLIYVANWPETRIQAWSTLLRARAIENQCYVVGVNRIGKDANNLNYIGHSAMIDMGGAYLSPPSENDQIVYATFDRNNLNAYKEKFPFYRDADKFEIQYL